MVSGISYEQSKRNNCLIESHIHY